MVVELLTRLKALRESDPAMRLYGLVDGLVYEDALGQRLQADQGRALFAGTPDAALAHAGPWLIDSDTASTDLANTLVDLEASQSAVSWLFASLPFELLVSALQKLLNAQLPDGRHALLRYYDPRVLLNLYRVMTAAQREQFFRPIHEWHLLNGDGCRLRIARP